jgi:hypothetical protein
MVCQRFPELAVDERYDAAGVLWCAAVILANINISMAALENCMILVDGHNQPSLIAATPFQHSAPSAHVCFMSCGGCIPARSDGRSSRYSRGPGDLVARCVSYLYFCNSTAMIEIYRLP